MDRFFEWKLLEWNVSERLIKNSDYRRRATVLGLVCGIICVISPIRVLGFAVIGDWMTASLYAVLFFINICLLYSIRRGASLWWPTQIFAFTVFSLVCMVTVKRGGVGATIQLVHGVIPLAVTYVLSVRAGMFWWGLALVFSVILSVLQSQGIVTLVDQLGSASFIFDAGVALVIPTAIIVMGAVYEWSRQEWQTRTQQIEQERATAEADVLVLRADKMASIGMFAAGVGHEVNNPLTYVQANIDFVLHELTLPTFDLGEVTEALTDAREGTVRIAKITRDLRSYSRVDSQAESVPTSLHDVVNAAVSLTQREIEQRSSLHLRLSPVPMVHAIESKLVQVMVNLLINAAHAVEEQAAGQIVVRSGARGNMAWVEVSDTGPGIPPEVQKRVFDPFFTTKEVGQGTGLGLSVSRSIVRSLGGRLSLRSQPGTGTIFRMSIPLAARPARDLTGTPVDASSDTHHILLIEDELQVAQAFIRMLKPHVVHWCKSSEEAFDLLKFDVHLDLVVCDVMLHPVSGWEIHDYIEHHHPDLVSRFVFVTGGAFTTAAQNSLEQARVPVLFKPVTRTDILAHLHKANSHTPVVERSA